MNLHGLNSGLLGDYCDGELYAKSDLFQGDPCALQIQLYYDELELCNPLGSKLGNFERLHVCITIQNMSCSITHLEISI